MGPRLLTVQTDMLRHIARAEREAGLQPGSQFSVVVSLGATSLHFDDGRGRIHGVEEGHMEDLGRAGLIRWQPAARSLYRGHITADGYSYLRSVTGPVEGYEQQVLRYLDDARMRDRYPTAMQAWGRAHDGLRRPATLDVIMGIGSECRVTLQQFLTELIHHRAIQGAPADPSKTKNRLRAIIERTVSLSERQTTMLVALLDAVEGAVQEATHAGEKQGDPVSADDARRVVFLTMVLMFEVDHALGGG